MDEHERDQQSSDQPPRKSINDPLTQGDADAPQMPWQEGGPPDPDNSEES